jgi:hypothetical protein
MISAALRRFGALFLASATGVALLSLLGGVALGSGVNRSLSVGFYVSGSAILIFGFFAGNRGPVRPKGDGAGFIFPLPGRMLRWASPTEQEESISLSAIFVLLGFALIIVGVLADTRYTLI